jgi:hypothetical protein
MLEKENQVNRYKLPIQKEKNKIGKFKNLDISSVSKR